jgi:hypothetical protein
VPRNVRNFWLTADIDGRHTRYASGPESADGGFDLVVKQRDSGEVTEALSILGRNIGGKLNLIVQDGHGNEVFRHITDR